jgi:hypothetical protein
MTGHDLSDLLERGANRTPVGSPPLDRILTRVRKAHRRRSALTVAASSVVVTAIVLSTAALSGIWNSPEDRSRPGTVASRPAAKTSTALNGTWVVRALLDGDGLSALPSSYVDKVRLSFYDTHPGLSGVGHHQMIGDTGCNTIAGTYRKSGNRGQDLVFARNLRSTLVGCRDEPPIFSRLLDVRHVSGSGDIRYLRDVDGRVVVQLRRASDRTPPVKPTGVITGRLFRIGGPYPGDPSALSHGTITLTGASSSETDVDSYGNFAARLSPGSYEVTATSPDYMDGHGTCETWHPVQVLANSVASVDVYCQLR